MNIVEPVLVYYRASAIVSTFSEKWVTVSVFCGIVSPPLF